MALLKPQPLTAKISYDKLIAEYTDPSSGMVMEIIHPLIDFENNVMLIDDLAFAMAMVNVEGMLDGLKTAAERGAVYYHIAKILTKHKEDLDDMGRTGKAVCKAINIDKVLIRQYFYSDSLRKEVIRDVYSDPETALAAIKKKNEILEEIFNDSKASAKDRITAVNAYTKPFEQAVVESRKSETMNFYGNANVDASENKQIEAQINVGDCRGNNDKSVIDQTRHILGSVDGKLTELAVFEE